MPADNNHLESSGKAVLRSGWRILAVLLGVVPVYALAIFMHLTTGRTYTAWEMIIFPLGFGVATIILILLLQKVLCRERIRELNPGRGTWISDMGWGLLILAILFALLFVEGLTVFRWLPSNPGQFDELFFGMLENPLMLVLWFGPVVWIGVALFEELTRVFMLHHLSLLWNSSMGRTGVVLLSAALFAAGHLYQGPAGVTANFITGLVLGIIYLQLRRFWPLVIAHALFDSLQIGTVLLMIRQDLS